VKEEVGHGRDSREISSYPTMIPKDPRKYAWVLGVIYPANHLAGEVRRRHQIPSVFFPWGGPRGKSKEEKDIDRPPVP